MLYRYEIQQRMQTARARGKGAEGRGGRNCGTYHGETWKQRGVTNDEQTARDCIQGFGDDWRVFDHIADQVLQ